MPAIFLRQPLFAALNGCVGWLLLAVVLFLTMQPGMAYADDFETALQGLLVKSFSKKKAALVTIEDTGNPRAKVVFEAMLDARLYYRKADRRLVFIKKLEEGYEISDAVTDEALGVVEKRRIRKIRINNSLRRVLKAGIARLSLASTDPQVRRDAVRQMFEGIDDDSRDLLSQALDNESEQDIQTLMRQGMALADLDSADEAGKLAAIELLTDSLEPVVRNRLRLLSDQTETAGVAKAAQRALRIIEKRLDHYALLETLFFGLSLGSVLLLAAIGLAITFGVMGVINMAHGELIMLGAYTTYLLQVVMPEYPGAALLLAIPLAFIVSGLFGIAIERGVISFLYGRPLETLLATFGISLILQQLVRSTISAQNVAVVNPSWMSGSLEINAALSITYNRLYIFFFALVVFTILQLILKKTRLGLHVRAVSQNRAMARAMGIRSKWVDAMTFGLGSGIAGVAGVALSQLTNVGPNMGQAYIIDSFMVVVFGGVGNLWGTLIGALSLGVVNKFMEPFTGAVLAKILVLLFIILFIQKRPRGLFPQKGRAA